MGMGAARTGSAGISSARAGVAQIASLEALRIGQCDISHFSRLSATFVNHCSQLTLPQSDSLLPVEFQVPASITPKPKPKPTRGSTKGTRGRTCSRPVDLNQAAGRNVPNPAIWARQRLPQGELRSLSIPAPAWQRRCSQSPMRLQVAPSVPSREPGRKRS